MTNRVNLKNWTTTTSGQSHPYGDSDSSTGGGWDFSGYLPPAKKVAPKKSQKKIENAVYAHLQALRALGQTKAETVEIARALSIPVRDVNAAVNALKSKGVRVSK